MPKYKIIHLPTWLGWVFLFLFHAAEASEGASVALSNASLKLQFDTSSGTVQHWQLPGVQDAKGSPHDLAAPQGQLFLLRGELAGKDLREWEKLVGGWKVLEQRPDTLVLGLTHTSLPFSIRKTWRLSDPIWRVQFDLDLDFLGTHLTQTDHLDLQVGPGIGEVPTHGLGMGQSIYSFTELVHHNSNGVNTLRLNEKTDLTKRSSNDNSDWNWVGLQSRYLALIMAPTNGSAQQAQWQAFVPELPTAQQEHAEFQTSVKVLLPVVNGSINATQHYSWSVFGGGKTYSALTATQPDLGGLLFSGLWDWMRVLCLVIMHVLQFIQQIIGSWGIAIIILAILVRIAVYPIAKKAILAQKKFALTQARIQPELQNIRQNYKGGEQSERILQLYESHQVSPLAGLKPLLIVLIQVPIFVALYHLLGQTFELRDASFLWIKSLAEPDQLFSLGIDLPLLGSYFNLLPVLMSLTTLLSIKLAPASETSTTTRQSISTALMGLGFFLLFYSFPSGMVLYWTVANILQVTHQKLAKAG
jgi:YidC/Oxa1 family membrane protein insertase